MSLADKPFVRNVAVVATGTFGAHGISMVFAPLVTRLYGPEAFGVLGTFNALLAVLIPVAALALPIAIVLPERDSEAASIGRLSIVVSLLLAVVTAGVLYVAGEQILALLSMQAIGPYLLLLPLAMLAAAMIQVFRQWLIRQHRFRHLANAGIVHALVLNLGMVVSGVFYPVAVALVAITVAGHGLHALLLGRAAKGRTGHSTEGYRSLLSRYRDFPLYRAPQDFINAVSQSIPVLMLASLFGAGPAGLYALGKLVMGAPSALIGTAVRDVFFPKVTRVAQQGDRIDKLIMKTTLALVLMGLLPFGLVAAFGPQLFSWVFGAEWSMAGEYARWLALFFFFNFINKPSVAAVPVLGIQRGLLIYELFSTGAKVLGLLAGYFLFQSDLVAVALFSVIGMLAYSSMIVWIILMAKAKGSHEH